MLHTVSERKWELCRGVGRSFGANRHELPEDIIGDTELIQMFCDVVSKNGNLLIGVGRARRHGARVPAGTAAGAGAWLAANGEAIYASRAWVVAETTTTEGTPLRFTQQRRGRLRAGHRHAGRPAGHPARRWTGRGCAGCAWSAIDELIDFSSRRRAA